jgi:uncharacterized protein
MKAQRQAAEITVGVGPRTIAVGLGALFLFALAVLIGLGRVHLPTVPDPHEGASLWLVFLTGLSVGGLSCLAVQGGLLAAMIAQRQTQLHAEHVTGWRNHSRPVLIFLFAKVAAYSLLGGLLGAVGSKIPLAWQGWAMVGAGVFMVAIALQLYDVHPALRHLSFSPPKSVQRLVRRQTRRDDMLAPVALGALTVFIPCGVTLAMEVMAIASHDVLRGAATMFAFTAGTMPLFLLVGFAATGLGQSAWRVFKPLAAVTVVAIALLSIVSGARLLGFGSFLVGGESQRAVVIEAPALATAAGESPGGSAAAPVASTIYQEATVNVATGGYAPPRVQVRAGVPIRLTLVTANTQGCIRAFVIPSLGIERMLPATGTETVELPAQLPGRIDFMCSMGMYTGVIEVGDQS